MLSRHPTTGVSRDSSADVSVSRDATLSFVVTVAVLLFITVTMLTRRALY